MSTNNNMLDKMLNTVMQSDIAVADKLTLIESLTNLNKNEELARDYEQATAPKETFKVTLKPSYAVGGNNKESVFGMERWEPAQRKELFKLVKDAFGPFSAWEGLSTPKFASTHEYKDALQQLAQHFGRTTCSIQSQIRDVVRPVETNKNKTNIKGIKGAKKLAFEVGLISEEELHD